MQKDKIEELKTIMDEFFESQREDATATIFIGTANKGNGNRITSHFIKGNGEEIVQALIFIFQDKEVRELAEIAIATLENEEFNHQ